MRADELCGQLGQFTGSASYQRHGLMPNMLLTEGIVFLATNAAAHWLIDAIASYLYEPRAIQEEFQVWNLAVDEASRKGVLWMSDGNSDTAIIRQELDYTDFPLEKIALWLVRDDRYWVLMLPSEY
jgi:hypothetical protein